MERPASESDIAELERRLDTSLPLDFKEFLGLSNGLGIPDDSKYGGLFNGVVCESSLYPSSKVDWSTDRGTFFAAPVFLLDLPHQITDLVSENAFLIFPDNTLHALDIGHCDIDYIFLLHPKHVRHHRDLYVKMYNEADHDRKKRIVRTMEEFAGSKDAFEAMDWCCVKWQFGGVAETSIGITEGISGDQTACEPSVYRFYRFGVRRYERLVLALFRQTQ